MNKLVIALAAAGTLAVGCATTRAPNQLVDARVAYQRATAVPGANMAASDLYEAKMALDAAEQAYADDGGDSNKTKNLAYIAQRKAVAAMGKAETLEALERKNVALAEFQKFKEAQAVAARDQLDRTKGALTSAQQQAEAERQARIAADAKVQEMLVHIQGLKAEESERGLVLTLSNGILFPAGKSELLPQAKTRLGTVAKALKDDKRKLYVVGHTDSTGTNEVNMRLSRERADAVRIYLVGQGIDDNRIRAEGMGKSQPVADNTSPEGRSANRRVEIILEKEGAAGGSNDTGTLKK